MRAGTDFEAAVRRGRRAGTPRVVVHCRRTASVDPPRVGFVVSRAVGGSVVRHRVVRRLREALRPQLGALPAGALVVVRAQPAAAAASFDDLCRDVARLLSRAGLVASVGATGGAR
jgi:ribonuclease P protein component